MLSGPLAARGFITKIGGAWWLDVDDSRAHTLAEEQAPRELAEIYRTALS